MSLSREELLLWVEGHTAFGENVDILANDCDIVAFLLDNCSIHVPPQNRFFVEVNCAGITSQVRETRRKRRSYLIEEAGLSDGSKALAYTGACDFGHTTAEWESVISLGIFGLRERIASFAIGHPEKRVGFYQNILRVYDAALHFMERAAEQAFASGRCEMADSLRNLCKGSPSNLFEALQTSLIYYSLQQYFDGTVLRTLGRLDQLFYPYFIREDRAVAEKMLLDYLREIDRIKATANIPFAIGGSDTDARSLINELSYVLLNLYGSADTTDTKLHLLCSENMPQDIIEKAFRFIRNGKNSIVLMSDKRIIEALVKQGIEYEDAVRYHVVGCYECGGEGELTCSCNARVNIPKALELALNRGVDMLTGKMIGVENSGHFESFQALCAEFERQLACLCKCAMAVTDLYEAHYGEMHAAPILSGTYTSALQKGGDLYLDQGAKYNNSSLNAIGLATAVDSLAAIRKTVFEDKILTLSELTEALRSDWSGKEPLRLLMKNKCPKYGQGDAATDAIAQRVVDVLSDAVSRKPNAKGGTWRLGLFSIDWRWEFGAKSAASANGRHAGETLSQNTSASTGADIYGATAHLISAARLDTSQTPNGAIVDVDLHSSAVRGENGIRALVASLKTYFELGGFAVHYNVLDTEILLDAKANPDKYPTLQVRLCGWNVLFSSLSEREKDEFIARSMK